MTESNDLPWKSVLASKPVLLIGPSGAQFYSHGDLLANCSSVLASAVNGQMQEAETRVIQIKDIEGDIDDDTLTHFLEFAYTDDYQVPAPTVVLTSKDIDLGPATVQDPEIKSPMLDDEPARDLVLESPTESDFGLRYNSGRKCKKCKKGKYISNGWQEEAVDGYEELLKSKHVPKPPSKQKVLWDLFCSKASVRQSPAWTPKENVDACEDWSKVLECHARLYVFSNRYECEKLRDLCLQKLRLTLSRWTFHQQRSSDITNLVRYSCYHTQDFESGTDKLRNLISDYVVCKIEELYRDDEFLNSLQELDGLARDLMVKLMARLQ